MAPKHIVRAWLYGVQVGGLLQRPQSRCHVAQMAMNERHIVQHLCMILLAGLGHMKMMENRQHL